MGDASGPALTFIFAALLIGGLALLLLVGVRALLGGISRPAPTLDASHAAASQPPPTRSEARRLLDERYARGELSTAEYREHVDNLGEGA
ncbi:MAG: SHOCT domain-containing protein [Intrasporangiaceae bacterium]|nr:SHOCT domain-containing protein [Intrasporangiaceae bacterium]